MDNIVILNIVWFVSFVLSAFMAIYNYGTKCVLNSGEYLRVYSFAGLMFRIIISLIPVINIFIFLHLFFEPFGLGGLGNWYNIKTKELCKRQQLEEKLSKHNSI